MRCGKIYAMTLAFIAESAEGGDTNDLKERFLPILNAFCSLCDEINKRFSGDDISFAQVSDIDDIFPLDERFAYPCALYAGALLLSDENPTLSAFLLSQSKALLDGIKADTPAVSENIVDKYS